MISILKTYLQTKIYDALVKVRITRTVGGDLWILLVFFCYVAPGNKVVGAYINTPVAYFKRKRFLW